MRPAPSKAPVSVSGQARVKRVAPIRQQSPASRKPPGEFFGSKVRQQAEARKYESKAENDSKNVLKLSSLISYPAGGVAGE